MSQDAVELSNQLGIIIRLDFYKRLNKKIDSILDAKLSIEDYSEEVYLNTMKLQEILDNRGYSRKQLEKTIEACQEALKNCVD
jgi:hypothetical protein